eukprot:4498106-Amphidinium_carterae.4
MLYQEIVACHDHAHEVDNITSLIQKHDHVTELSSRCLECAMTESTMRQMRSALSCGHAQSWLCLKASAAG